MKVLLELAGDEFDAFILREADKLKITIDGESFDAKVSEGGVVKISIAPQSDGDKARPAGHAGIGDKTFHVHLHEKEATIDGSPLPFRVLEVKTGAAGGEGSGARGARVKPPMPGKIVTVAVSEGDEVKAGQVLVILEAMKMQNEIVAPASGIIKKLNVKPGQNVEGKDVIIEIE